LAPCQNCAWGHGAHPPFICQTGRILALDLKGSMQNPRLLQRLDLGHNNGDLLFDHSAI